MRLRLLLAAAVFLISAPNVYCRTKEERIRDEYDRLLELREKILSMEDVLVYNEADYREKLKVYTVTGNVKERRDAAGGFSKVQFRVKKLDKRDREGRRIRLPVAIKIMSPPDFMKRYSHIDDLVDQLIIEDDKHEDMYEQYFNYVDSLDQAINEYNVAKVLRNYKMYYYGKVYNMYRSRDNTVLYIVMDYMNGKDMDKYIFPKDLSKSVILTQDEAVRNAARIGEMLLKLRWAGIIYRDLKMQNMVMDTEHKAYMIDMGLAMILNTTKNGYATDFCGTPFTMSPETIEEKPQGYQVDVWSFGVVLYMFLTGNKYPNGPFGDHESDDDDEYIDMILHRSKTEKPNFDEPIFQTLVGELARDLLEKMLVYESQDRLTMEEVLKHEWFHSQGYYFDHLFNEGKDMKRTDKAKPPEEVTDFTLNEPEDIPDEHLKVKPKMRELGLSNRMWSARGRKQHTQVPTVYENATPVSTVSIAPAGRTGFEALLMLQKCIHLKQPLPNEFELRDPVSLRMETFFKDSRKKSGARHEASKRKTEATTHKPRVSSRRNESKRPREVPRTSRKPPRTTKV